ncbi:phosphonate C-P lyase system protein PhnL [Caldicellulosiruptor morganii]|uniref:ATP-binding cassette domain-containing protein n=1 Tax=Caldicellulosiruptor morganii TaxID=1387555 RepID=A0ABY7BKX3_9FIRM|nr:ATP-binding cassette domain-containing protein [Caldicellulosiruptor morganii]WAM33475.1 ATP-binding cassette domain-containing protein [Caldicellulosiruptor morganii]
MESILEVKNLSKHFVLHMLQKKKIKGFENISFSLKEKEAIGIIGKSGSGKSSLLKCIYRTYIPTSGSVIFNSKIFGPIDLASASEDKILVLRNKEISYVSQFFKVIPRVSAIEIVSSELLKRGKKKEEAYYIASQYLERLDIPKDLWDAYPATFSGGQQQRLNIIKAIIVKPRLLLIDEPTASLDRYSKNKVIDLLLELKDEGTSIVGVFHDTDSMKRLVDKVYKIPEHICEGAEVLNI